MNKKQQRQGEIEIDSLDKVVNNFRKQQPDMGLPQNIFHFISRSTPVVNVDLLIKDSQNNVLLSWRDDEFAGSAWHVPGGIVRFKETLEQRLNKVADLEIGCSIEYNPVPLCIEEVLLARDTRSHFISFLYACRLSSDTFEPSNKNLCETDAGYLKWHKGCPENLVEVQKMYRSHIEDVQSI